MYKQWQEAVQIAASEGAYEGIEPRLLNLMEGMFPVGIEDDGSITVPASYNPINQVPVLAGESVKPIRIDNLVAAAVKIRPPLLVPPSFAPVNTLSYSDKIGAALTVTEYVDIQSEGVSHQLAAPALMAINPECVRLAPAITAHELDHWLHYLHLPPFHTENMRPIKTRAERLAYGTSLRVGQNLGAISLTALDQILSVPLKSRKQLRNVRRVVGEANKIGKGYWGELAARVLWYHYGPSDPLGPATTDEVYAYRAAGIINV